jgi:Caspase domain
LLGDVGQLSDKRIYTNDRATRKQLEETITRWLPSVSRPGDTVLIFFSGHGMQIDDDNGDEPVGKDEVIAPHDTVTGDILVELLKKVKDGGPVDPRLPGLVELAKKAGPKAADALVRASAISDDVFGHWLQRLDGRQVIVILDTCHSGGLAPGDKGIDGQAQSFDFLDRELSRLKDIGQRECSLLAACSASQSAQVRREQDLSVMTHCLVELLRESKGPVELRQGYEGCVRAMKTYFDEVNRSRREGEPRIEPHQPRLVIDGVRPAFLKP